MLIKRSIALVLILSVFTASCASTPANPVPVAQIGDDTKTCNAIVNELQQMVSAQIVASGDRGSQIAGNALLFVTGVFLIVPWFFMNLGSTATVEERAAAARYQRLQQMAADRECPNVPVMPAPDAAKDKEKPQARQGS